MMKKFMLRVMPIVLMAVLIIAPAVWAAPYNPLNNNPANSITKVDDAVQKIWGTVLTVLQVCAVAALVFAGVKYMFASADGKADIKNGMMGLVIGAILVFGASAVIKLIINASTEITGGNEIQ